MFVIPRDRCFVETLITTCTSFVDNHLQPMLRDHDLSSTESSEFIAAASVLTQHLQPAVDYTKQHSLGWTSESGNSSTADALSIPTARSAAHCAASEIVENYDSESTSDGDSASSSDGDDSD